MQTERGLENLIGGHWLGVSLYAVPVRCKQEYTCPNVDRFCEALKIAKGDKVLVDPQRFACLGARYVFSCGDDQRRAMVRKLADARGCSDECAARLIDETPRCIDGIRAIGINLSDRPDVFIATLQPTQVMRVVQLYQAKLGRIYQTEISSVMSACGNTFVKALQLQNMAISFGCDDSRKFGDVGRDRLFVGLPLTQARAIVG